MVQYDFILMSSVMGAIENYRNYGVNSMFNLNIKREMSIHYGIDQVMLQQRLKCQSTMGLTK